jgi:hypothetical protein
MEDAFTIGDRLKAEALKAREQNLNDADWQMLRSDIYVRDKGICWICNTFVELKDYDLGHLIDRCNNGEDSYDNLAVMHKSCNLSKPKHTSLEEAMKWKLTPKYLTERPISMFDSSKSIGKGYPYPRSRPKKSTSQLSLETYNDRTKSNHELISSYTQAHPELTDTVRLEAIKLLSQILDMPEKSIKPIINSTLLPSINNSQTVLPINIEHLPKKFDSADNHNYHLTYNDSITLDNLKPLRSRYEKKFYRKHRYATDGDKTAAKQLVLEHFKNNPLLCEGKVNHARSNAIKQLSNDLKIPLRDIREWIVDANLVPRKQVICNGDQYLYVINNLEDLKNKHSSIGKTKYTSEKAKLLNITSYQLQIFYFLTGQLKYITPKNLHGIVKQISNLKYKGIIPGSLNPLPIQPA